MTWQLKTHRARNLDVLSIINDKLRCSLAPLTFGLQDNKIVVGALDNSRNTCNSILVISSNTLLKFVVLTVRLPHTYMQACNHDGAGLMTGTEEGAS